MIGLLMAFSNSFGQNTFPLTGNVGVGVSSPLSALDVRGVLHVVTPEYGTYTAGQGSYLGWNKSGGGGEVNLVNSIGGGNGGFAFDQTANGTTFSRLFTLSGNGNTGIGTMSPGAKLSFNDVNDGTSVPSGITWYNPSPLTYGIHRTEGSWIGPDYQQMRISWEAGVVINPGVLYGKCYLDVQGGGLRVTAGNVGIGTIDTKGYKLAVAGSMIAESVKVKLQSSWPDFVFAESYKLPTLQETENHIKEKGHLPGIPSAAELKDKGIDLGDMNGKLLQKIEELTLHLIEKDKQLSKQQLTIDQQESRLKKLENFLKL